MTIQSAGTIFMNPTSGSGTVEIDSSLALGANSIAVSGGSLTVSCSNTLTLEGTINVIINSNGIANIIDMQIDGTSSIKISSGGQITATAGTMHLVGNGSATGDVDFATQTIHFISSVPSHYFAVKVGGSVFYAYGRIASP
jgi:hypothetical protein